MRRYALAALILLCTFSSAWTQPANMLSQAVGFLHKETCVTPAVTTANAYGTNFVVSGLNTFNNALGAAGTGKLRGIFVGVKKVESSGFSFTLFNDVSGSTTWTDAAVANINAADVGRIRYSVSLTATSILGTHTFAYAYPDVALKGGNGQTLYGVLTTNAALTNNFTSTTDVDRICIVTEFD